MPFVLNLYIFAVLNPQLKTDYFEAEEWKREWIDTAKEVITNEWDTYYKNTETLTGSEENHGNHAEVRSLFFSF